MPLFAKIFESAMFKVEWHMHDIPGRKAHSVSHTTSNGCISDCWLCLCVFLFHHNRCYALCDLLNHLQLASHRRTCTCIWYSPCHILNNINCLNMSHHVITNNSPWLTDDFTHSLIKYIYRICQTMFTD